MLSILSNTVEGAAILNDIRSDFVRKERGKPFWQHWFDWFRPADANHISTDWYGPKKDMTIRLDAVKIELQKQMGYF